MRDLSSTPGICPIREQDGQASGGNDFGSDDWIFTIREKDPKKLQNGEGQSTDQVLFTGSKLRVTVTWSHLHLTYTLFLYFSHISVKRHSKEALFTEPGHSHLSSIS